MDAQHPFVSASCRWCELDGGAPPRGGPLVEAALVGTGRRARCRAQRSILGLGRGQHPCQARVRPITSLDHGLPRHIQSINGHDERRRVGVRAFCRWPWPCAAAKLAVHPSEGQIVAEAMAEHLPRLRGELDRARPPGDRHTRQCSAPRARRPHGRHSFACQGQRRPLRRAPRHCHQRFRVNVASARPSPARYQKAHGRWQPQCE